jgi:hypothetical protein
MATSPILSVMFVHESGYVESYKPDEIRAAPEVFRAILAEHKTAGRKPMVLRQISRATPTAEGVA